jgi:hypothetical protein
MAWIYKGENFFVVYLTCTWLLGLRSNIQHLSSRNQQPPGLAIDMCPCPNALPVRCLKNYICGIRVSVQYCSSLDHESAQKTQSAWNQILAAPPIFATGMIRRFIIDIRIRIFLHAEIGKGVENSKSAQEP